jgi:hypothetical protein
VSDHTSVDDETPSAPEPVRAASVATGGVDWLLESHRESVPMAPLSDDVPSPVSASLSVGSPPAPAAAFSGLISAPPPNTAHPATPTAFPEGFGGPGAGPSSAPRPADASPEPAVAVRSVSAVLAMAPPPAAPPAAPTLPPVVIPGEDRGEAAPFVFGAEPGAASTFAASAGVGAFGLERRAPHRRSATGPLDWVALVLSVIAPPLGLLAGIGAVIGGVRARGYAAGVAKAAIGIGAALTLVLGVAFIVGAKISNDNAAHEKLVSSSRAWCAGIASDRAALASDTFGWPAPGATIPDSIAAMQSYESRWEKLAGVAPAGIRADTRKVATTAKSIVTSVQTTQTLDDSSNIVDLQNVVATSAIPAWVSDYCS